jgi:uncharacterized protein GlcG (DUF336 family)
MAMPVGARRRSERNAIELDPLEPRRLLSGAHALLTHADVDKILAAAASQATPSEVITVVGREGEILGIFARNGADLGPVRDQAGHLDNPQKGVIDADSIILGTVAESVARARTAADFESAGEAFTTRTARFIVQNHFPPNLDNTPGGPLYGVEFSSLPDSDVTKSDALSGDPGGVPLYIDGQPVGGIGVAGDSDNVLAVPGLPYKHGTHPTLYNGVEEFSFDEAVALAGQEGYAPPSNITANNIFVGGLRLPYVAESAASGKPRLSITDLENTNAGFLVLADSHTIGGVDLEDNSLLGFPNRTSSAVIGEPATSYPSATFAGNTGTLKNTNPVVNQNKTDLSKDFGFTSGAAVEGKNGQMVTLSTSDVSTIITDAVAQAEITRAGIREPLGTNAVVHVAVTDTQGNILGVFAMNDATDFSYDVAVQKARTAAFFSSNTAAISSTAVGFLGEEYFPQGIEDASRGPLYELQNALSLDLPSIDSTGKEATSKLPLENGITIFPGGIPLYKDGVLVGAVGISGDGVNQDDLIAYGGTAGFRPPTSIEADSLSNQQLVNIFTEDLDKIDDLYPDVPGIVSIVAKSKQRIKEDLDIRLPYVKFPRDPLTSG